MNEKTNKAGATSGQNVPKSKFRHKSQQEQTAASKLRMEKRGEKLEKAKEKLAKQKPPKPPGPARRVAGTVGGGVHGYVHGKIFEVEQENVGKSRQVEIEKYLTVGRNHFAKPCFSPR